MKQETHIGKHTDAQIEQRGRRQHWWYTIVSVGVGAIAPFWADSCHHQSSIPNTTPHYYDTPVDAKLRSEAHDNYLPPKKHEWLYVEPSLDSHSMEAFASLPSKQKGGIAMSP